MPVEPNFHPSWLLFLKDTVQYYPRTAGMHLMASHWHLIWFLSIASHFSIVQLIRRQVLHAGKEFDLSLDQPFDRWLTLVSSCTVQMLARIKHITEEVASRSEARRPDLWIEPPQLERGYRFNNLFASHLAPGQGQKEAKALYK